MTDHRYDAIVVGARCAGAPTAMLLARLGHRVLVVDRATFPSDTVSTHVLHPSAVAALQRWGVLDEVLATGCPAVPTYSFDFGAVTIAGTPRSPEGLPAYAPRRTLLDKILVDAARDAGAEVREGFTVDEVLMEDGAVVGIRGRDADGRVVVERAPVVIGADGHRSRVARAVDATVYEAKPALQFAAYTYWRDLPVDGFEIFVRPSRGWAAVATNDELTLLVVGWPTAEEAAYKADIEGNYLRTLGLVPEFAARVGGASRADRFHTGAVPNEFRTPYGPGWLLLGDAGYVKDPITAQGIPDAFADAERAAAALHEVFSGRAGFGEALARAHAARDAHAGPIFELTTQLATLEPPPPEMQQLLGAISTDRAAMDDFVSVVAGSLSPTEFFDPANLGRLLSPATA
jgi:2-polyprenyl-6-methoxyphenol hydroxylase-like FAD-dependent oxidoreductase